MRSILLALLVTACGSVLPATYTADDLPDLSELTEEWGCGTGFWLSDRSQTVTLQIAYRGEDGPEGVVALPHDDWKATLIEGTDLYSNWCDDVIEAHEPVPAEHWELDVVEGTLHVIGKAPELFSGGELAVEAQDLVVELPDGTLSPLGSVAITNPNWGFFAG